MSPNDPPSRVLIVRPSALGDVARTVPALVSIAKAWPEARIDWLVRDDFSCAIAHHPDLHEVIPFHRRRLRKWWCNPKVAGELLGMLRQLKGHHYDKVYDLQGLGRSGFFTWATRSKHRVGSADAREFAAHAYTKKVQIDDAVTHTVDRMLAVLAGDGIEPVYDMRLNVGHDDRLWAERYLGSHGLDDKHFAVIAPTAKWRCKCWPAERYAALADQLPQYEIDTALVVGGPGEQSQTAPLFENADNVKLLDLVGNTTVGQLMALIERASVVFCNDSAAAHLSVGLGRRMVCLFGPTDPARVGPYRYDLSVIRPDGVDVKRYRAQPNDQSLISRITVDQAAATLQQIMTSPPPPVT